MEYIKALLTHLNIDNPTLLTAFSSIFTLTPSTSPFFPLLTLPALLIQGHKESSRSTLNIFKKLLGTTLASTSGSLYQTWGILPSGVEQVLSQIVFSLFIGLILGFCVGLQSVFIETKWVEDCDDWVFSPIFGLTWAGVWLTWSKISPFGGYGNPVPLDNEIARKILPLIGTTGVDFLVGTFGHVVSKVFSTATRNCRTDEIKLGEIQGPSHLEQGSVLDSDSNSSNRSGTSDTGRTIEIEQTGPHKQSTRRSRRLRQTWAMPLIENTDFKDIEEEVETWKGPRKLALGLVSLLAIVHSSAPYVKPELSDPINQISPLSVACIIPPQPHPTVEDLVLLLRQVGNRAQLIFMPETALALRWEDERNSIVDTIIHEVCRQYGVWVMLSLETPARGSKHHNEVTLLAPHGMVGRYAKRSLFPLIESTRYVKGDVAPPVWTMNMSHPHGVTKPEWSTVPPFVRRIDFTPLICLDALHPDYISTQPSPSFLLIPAANQPILAGQVVHHAQILSATRNIPSVVCSRGVSAAIDEGGDVIHEQEGGKGFIARLAIPWYGDYGERIPTFSEKTGNRVMLGLLTAGTTLIKALEVYVRKGSRGLIEGVEYGLLNVQNGGKKVRKLIEWRKNVDSDEEVPLLRNRPVSSGGPDSGIQPSRRP